MFPCFAQIAAGPCKHYHGVCISWIWLEACLFAKVHAEANKQPSYCWVPLIGDGVPCGPLAYEDVAP